jgi:hypothetical protein
MPSQTVYCPACSKTYRVYLDNSTSFLCSDCGAKINPHLEELHKSYKPPKYPITEKQDRPEFKVGPSKVGPSKVVSYRTNIETEPEYAKPKTNQQPFTKQKETRGRFGIWLVMSVVLYLICAFSQFDGDISAWSSIARAILAIGVIGFGIFANAIKFD